MSMDKNIQRVVACRVKRSKGKVTSNMRIRFAKDAMLARVVANQIKRKRALQKR